MRPLYRFLVVTFIVGCVGCALSGPLHAQDASLSGQVVNSAGRGIANLTVKVSLAGGGNFVTATDGNGHFELRDLRSGRYLLTVLQGLTELHREPLDIRGATVRQIRV
jgi:hypothetical protein